MPTLSNPTRWILASSLGSALLLAACGPDSGPADESAIGGDSAVQVGGSGVSGGSPSGGTGGSPSGVSGGSLSGGSGAGPSGGSSGSPSGGAGGTASGGVVTATGGTSASGGGPFGTGGTGVGASGGAGGLAIGGAPGGGGAAVTGGTGGTANGGTAGEGPVGTGGAGGGADVCPTPQAQACLYVSPSGSDDAVGSASEPFLTLARARDEVRTLNADMTGDIFVYLRGGDHRITSPLTLGPEDSGTNDHRIIYQAYPGETPVLNGATRVTGWAPHEGSIYRASLERSTKLRNLTVNDARASMASKTAAASGGYGDYSVTAGQAPWAWTSGSGSDGVQYRASDVPAIANNQDDLEIVNGTTWNENVACVRGVETTADGQRGLLLQQPYGAIAQLPGWNAGFSVTGTHTLLNAYEFLSEPGQFFFDKTAQTLYYIPRPGEDMATAVVEVPVAQTLVDIAGTSRSDRVHNLTFRGLTFAHTDYGLYQLEGSCGKASVQGATIYIAFGNGDWHASKYEIVDTLPAMFSVSSAESIELRDNVFKHSGSEGIAMHNDVVGARIVGNYVTDMAGSGVTIGHPQHVYLGDEGAHARYSADVEGICTDNTIANNFFYDVSTAPGFGGHAAITAFFVDTLSIVHNQIHTTAYNGINLGWGWRNFQDSTTSRDNTVSFNRLNNLMTRLHDSGAIYTIGQNPGTTIDQNYVKGIPPATSGPTYGLHNDEGSAYITENDNVLDIDPGVKYTINCEDFGEKHDLTILRTYATVNKMGVDPPNSQIDPPVAVPDAVWPLTQYGYCLNAGIEEAYRGIIPSALVALPDYVFPASCGVSSGTGAVDIKSSGDPANTVWLAPAGTSTFLEGATMTRAPGDATSIAVPASAGSYRLFVVDAQGQRLGESAAQLRVGGG